MAVSISIAQLPDGRDQFPNSDEWEIEVWKKYQDFWMYYALHKYWFDADFCRDIDKMFNVISHAIHVKVMYLYTMETNKDNSNLLDRYYSESSDAHTKLAHIEERLVVQLRELIGVSASEQPRTTAGPSYSFFTAAR